MMLGSRNPSSFISNSGDVTSAAATAAAAEPHDSISGGAGGGSTEVGGATGAILSGFSEDDKAGIEESERGGGGNRWPRQETLDLLRIRSEMDDKFRDSSLKGPLWEEVSRKMAELGFQRSAKKCKEKFENVYKYHKRTKEGRATKSDGKAYRFFDQLEALENNPNSIQLSPQSRPNPQPPLAATPMPASATNPQISSPHITVSSTPNTVSFSQSLNHPIISSSFPPSQAQLPPPPLPATNTLNPPQGNAIPTSHHHVSTSLLSNSTSSSTSSDDDIASRHKRKRKWKDYFERLIQDVIDKQEELQNKFLETLEKRERDRMIREEAWRVQEMARMNREIELLAQERSMAASKDAAVIAFLQKVSEQQNLQDPSGNVVPQFPVQLQVPQNPSSLQPSPQQQLPQPSAPISLLQQPAPAPAPSVVMPAPAPVTAVAPAPTTARSNLETPSRTDNGGENHIQPSSSRWPKAEVHALIRMRTNLDTKYQENGPKGPLWEEISAGMRKLGYNRNAKRCKEKWENINKYFKKVKESNKKRPEDAKTCPYFHQLDALYKEKTKADPNPNPHSFGTTKPDMVPIMARPEQQWPLPPQQQGEDNDHDYEHDPDSNNIDHNDHDDDDDDGDDDDEEDEGGGYEIVTNKAASVTSAAE